MRTLIIAEKPSLMRDIQSAYKTSTRKFDADFTAFRGHFMELKEPNDYKQEWGKPWNINVLPMIPDKFEFSVKEDCKADFIKIKKMLKENDYDFVVNACDAGREGEAIFWTFYNNSNCNLPVKRLWASDTTIETLSKALDNLLDYKTDKSLCALKDSSLCRMYFDWLIGMNLSRTATLLTKKLIPVGRVQTPTLNIVVKRDLEIENFKSKDFYEIEVDFEKYIGSWFNPETKETSFDTKEKAQKLIDKLSNKGVVENVKDEKIIEYAPALFSLAELQKEANKTHGLTASETLDLAQSLYEKHKIISYPRTESRALSTNLAKEIYKHLEALKDVEDVKDYVQPLLADKKRIDETMSNKKYVDNKKVTDHHAIINTKIKPDLSKLSANEKKVYLLIIKKFVSIFMEPNITNKTTIITNVSNEKFKTTGSVLVQMGYKELYRDASKNTELPLMKKGDTVNVKKIDLKAKKTEPPKPYDDSSLLAIMQNAGRLTDDEKLKEILNETKGLGTSATRASIIEKLIEKQLLMRQGKTIRSTDFGKKVIEILENKDVISPELTASWEEKLQNIEELKMDEKVFMKEMEEYTIYQTKDFMNTIKATFSQSNNQEVFGKCPVCNSKALLTAKYILCENYKKETGPSCNFVISKNIGGRDVPDTELKKLINKQPTKIMKFKSKEGKSFEAMLIFDDTDKKVKYSFGDKKTVGKCPKCGSDFIDKGKACSCEKCDFFISKNIAGATLTEKDIVALINGKETVSKSFNKNGNTWSAKMKYNSDFTKLDFIFDKNKK